MNELNPNEKPKIAIEATKQDKEERQEIYRGKIKPKRGHTLFQMHEPSKELTKAEFRSQSVDYELVMQENFKGTKEVVENSDCVYISALNETNAVKKYEKFLKSGGDYEILGYITKTDFLKLHAW
jgi:hypothetical protein